MICNTKLFCKEKRWKRFFFVKFPFSFTYPIFLFKKGLKFISRFKFNKRYVGNSCNISFVIVNTISVSITCLVAWLSCPSLPVWWSGCPILVYLPGGPVLVVLSWFTCLLVWLSCPGLPICLSGCPVLVYLSADLVIQFCLPVCWSGCPILVYLSADLVVQFCLPVCCSGCRLPGEA